MSKASLAMPADRALSAAALFARGFRPFFLAAGAMAILALAGWLAVLQGGLLLPSAYDPLSWHAHEMLFGSLGAALAGFLLTAIPNWTGRLPLAGRPLAALVALWLAGRLAMAFGGSLGMAATAGIDMAFWVVLVAAIAREILAGRNWRNLPVLAALGLFVTANGLFHAARLDLAASYESGWRLGIAVLVFLVSLIGGRIVPSFTGNWLAQRDRRRPRPASRKLELSALLVTLGALLCWAFLPARAWPFLAAAGLLQSFRLSRWQGWRTGSEALVWSLHLAFAWLPLALLIAAAASLWPHAVPPSAAIHALTAGLLSTMVVAVMTRAILGHTGRPLTAGSGTIWIYGLIHTAAALRVAAAFATDTYVFLLGLSGAAWIVGFTLFLGIYAPLCLRSRPVAAG